MIRITEHLLNEVSAKARVSLRRRMNHNFHPELSDPVQRLLNALEPWTYIRPHKHITKEESFVLLRGKVLAVTFEDNGTISDFCMLHKENGNLGIEFGENTYHMLTSLETGSVVYEIKEGPFVPHASENQAPWAPDEHDYEGAKRFLQAIFEQTGIAEPE